MTLRTSDVAACRSRASLSSSLRVDNEPFGVGETARLARGPAWRRDFTVLLFVLRCPDFLSLLGLRLDLHRQRELEHRALAELRLDPKLAAVHFDDAPRDRKAEAGAALLLGGGIVGLLEFLKNLALVGLGDAGAIVLHGDRE